MDRNSQTCEVQWERVLLRRSILRLDNKRQSGLRAFRDSAIYTGLSITNYTCKNRS